jgi:putative glutamine amidotransferase
MKPKALIGIIPDYKSGAENEYSVKSYYALRCNYTEMVAKAGGIPVILPYNHSTINDYLLIIDGLMIVGGNCDISPARYGAAEIHPSTTPNETRENFEVALASEAIKINIPIFGICNGMQLINVLYGGDIIQNIADDDNYINHEQSRNPSFKDSGKPYHQVNIKSETLLYNIAKTNKINTNSSHHQAIKNVGSALRISATADDGIIEAIENPSHPFCLGVQWHPEFETNDVDQKIFTKFVETCKKHI